MLAHWDELRLESHAVIGGEPVLYQQGAVSGLLPPTELLSRFGASAGRLEPGQAMPCGTLATIGGVRPAEGLRISLIDPVLDRRIDHEYPIRTLPIIE